MVKKSANTLQGRVHMRPLFNRGSSTRSVRSADKKDAPVRDVNVARQRLNHRVRFADDNNRETPSEGPLTDEEKKLYYYTVSILCWTLMTHDEPRVSNFHSSI
jgi:hypothetical protein